MLYYTIQLSNKKKTSSTDTKGIEMGKKCCLCVPVWEREGVRERWNESWERGDFSVFLSRFYGQR